MWPCLQWLPYSGLGREFEGRARDFCSPALPFYIMCLAPLSPKLELQIKANGVPDFGHSFFRLFPGPFIALVEDVPDFVGVGFEVLAPLLDGREVFQQGPGQ